MSFALGPLAFTAPLALLALIGLPLLWFVLRATPPQPKTQVLPSLALFEDLAPKEETPDQTPWWIILLRMMMITLAIIGLSAPVWSPSSSGTGEDTAPENMLLIIDNGWTSAPNWSATQSAAMNALSAMDRDQAVYVVTSTDTDFTDEMANRLSPQEARAMVRTIRPNGWLSDYQPLVGALENAPDGGLRTLWISDGQAGNGFDALSDGLKALGAVDVIPVTDLPVVTMTGLGITPDGPALTLMRSSGMGDYPVTISAFDETGRSVASARGSFAADADTARIAFNVPEAVQGDMAYFRLTGGASAGGVWQWEGSNRLRRVGLLSEGQVLQPLLSDTYYVRKALEPFATVQEGTLDELIAADLNVIVLTDVGELTDTVKDALETWIQQGGVLVRFAGPRLAAQADSLLPVRLRRASRALDSALSWDTPQALAGFPSGSPFATFRVPEGVMIRRQVLAQPDALLDSRTWARLDDGTPLVTSAGLGSGRITLFHVTAGPEWSDLPLSGGFVDMLRRATLPARSLGNVSVQPDTSLAPQRWLNGFGDFIAPAPSARPIQMDDLEALTANADHPAGLYRGGAVTLPLNAGSGWQPQTITSWPAGITVLSAAERSSFNLGGFLLAAALVLLIADLLLSLVLAGRLTLIRTASASAVFLLSGLVMLSPGDATAQTRNTNAEASDPTLAAALDLRFGYVRTGDSATDRKAEAGLRGLSFVLFRRTTVEPANPIGLDLASDPLNVYPMIWIELPEDGLELNDEERAALSEYLRNGGAIVIETATGGINGSGGRDPRLPRLLEGLDIPPLLPVDEDHVLTRSFYLLNGFHGRYQDRPIWVESGATTTGDERRGDGISGIFISDADLSAAWAMDDRGRPLYSVDGGQRNRELAYRTGINIVMYILTGNYKEDQVHLPSLLERLGEVTNPEDTPVVDEKPARDGEPTDITGPGTRGDEE